MRTLVTTVMLVATLAWSGLTNRWSPRRFGGDLPGGAVADRDALDLLVRAELDA